MFERKSDKPNERAQVGIGTLIVFIAMVLVAAIAAGVLINTAGFLQEQGSQAGEEAGQQVTNQLQTVEVTGFTDDDDSHLDKVEIVVTKGPASGNIDLSDVLAQYTSSTASTSLTEGTAGGSEFSVTALGDASGTVLSDSSDRMAMTFDIGSLETDDGLAPADSATITLNTADGSSTSVIINVPETLEGQSVVDL